MLYFGFFHTDSLQFQHISGKTGHILSAQQSCI